MAVGADRGLEIALTDHLEMDTFMDSLILVRMAFLAGLGHCDRVCSAALELLDRMRRPRVFGVAVGAVVLVMHGRAQTGGIDMQRQRLPVFVFLAYVLAVTCQTILIVTA